jgi:hypothetical protein
MLWRKAKAASVGILAISRMVWMWRFAGSLMSLASG